MAQSTQLVNQAMPVGQLLIRPNPFLGLLPRQYWKQQKQYYGYVVEFLPATLSVVTTTQLNIQNDAAFAAIAINATAFDVTNATPLADGAFPFLFQVFDSGVGRNWFSSPVQLENVRGNGRNPGVLPFPIIIQPGATLTCQITNLVATSYNVRLVVEGFKIFDMAEQA